MYRAGQLKKLGVPWIFNLQRFEPDLDKDSNICKVSLVIRKLYEVLIDRGAKESFFKLDYKAKECNYKSMKAITDITDKEVKRL